MNATSILHVRDLKFGDRKARWGLVITETAWEGAGDLLAGCADA